MENIGFDVNGGQRCFRMKNNGELGDKDCGAESYPIFCACEYLDFQPE